MKATINFSAESEAAGVFGRTLARHLQSAMTATPSAYTAVEVEERTTLPEEEDLLLAMALDAEGPDQSWCVDLGAALSLQPMRKAVLLSGLAEQLTALYGQDPGPAATLAVASGLRRARPLVALDKSSADLLNVLGCGRVRMIRAPALPPFVMAPDPERTTILVFDHIGSPIAIGMLKDAVSKASDDLTLCFVDELMPAALRPFFSCVPYFSEWPLRAGIHLHLGVPQGDRPGTRIVDSQACNRPVICFTPVNRPGPQPGIIHDRDGLLCTDGVELTAALNTVLGDPFFGELLAKNARRNVSSFNQLHAEALRDVIREAA